MKSSVISFEELSEVVLAKVNVMAIENKVDVSNKTKLVNYALKLLNDKL